MPVAEELKSSIAEQLGVRPNASIGTAQLSQILSIKTSTLDAWTSRSKGPRYLKIGKRRFYRVSDVAEWLAAQSHDTKESRAASTFGAEIAP